MNKIDILKELDSLKLDKNTFWVVGTASLVLRGILESANDIDIVVTEEGFNLIKEKYNHKYLGENNNYKWYELNEIIEFCIDQKTKEKVEDFDPYNLLDLNYYYLNFLKNSNREKEQEKIKLIEQVLNL